MNADPRLPRWSEEGSEVPSELRQLLRASREQLGTGEEIAQLSRALAQHIGPAAGLGGTTIAAVSTSWLALARWPAWLAAGTAIGALVWYAASGARHAPQAAPVAAPVQLVEPRTAPSAVEPSPAPPASEPARDDAGDTPREPPADTAQRPGPAPGKVHARPPAQSSVPSTRESALLQRAQSALAGDPARALALTDQHRRSFPAGALREEREAIAIQALRSLGREPEARARAARFETKYPNSVHRSRVQATPAQQ
jgi:hypothetical protein